MYKLILLIFISAVTHAQWLEEVKLGTHAGTSHNSKSISVTGKTIHVVLSENNSFFGDIFYKCSTDDGITWQPDKRISFDQYDMYGPSLAIYSGFIHVIWQSDDGIIFYNRSPDNGISWESAIKIVNNNMHAYLPAISVTGEFVNVVWNQSNEIYYKRSSDNGATWSSDTRLTNDPGFSYAPSIFSEGSNVYVTWEDEVDSYEEIFYKRSDDRGISWGEPKRLTTSSGYSQWPSISGFGSNVYIVWHEEIEQQSEIYFIRSTDNGSTWGTEKRLTYKGGYSWNPHMTASNSILHLGWMDYRDGSFKIFYKRSTDSGENWNEDKCLTNNSRWAENPDFTVTGIKLHMIWDDVRDGSWGVYYKCNPTGNKIGLVNIDPIIPGNYLLYQNYPNPFNPGTVIKFALPQAGNAKLVIYNITGEKISTVVNEYLEAGTYETEFNAISLSSGVYFYRLITETFSDTKKMILQK